MTTLTTAVHRVEDLPRLRASLRQLLNKAGASGPAIADVLLATQEAVANGIEHGNGDVDATVRVGRSLARVDVLDRGPGGCPVDVPVPDLESERGRGLFLMHALMDECEVVPFASGTLVRMARGLS